MVIVKHYWSEYVNMRYINCQSLISTVWLSKMVVRSYLRVSSIRSYVTPITLTRVPSQTALVETTFAQLWSPVLSVGLADAGVAPVDTLDVEDWIISSFAITRFNSW